MKNSIIIIILLCLVACNKKETKSSTVIPPTALSKLQGTWKLCNASGGTNGDYSATQVISNTHLTYTEYRYASNDGSCVGPILSVTASYDFTIGTDVPLLWPEATPINATFDGPVEMTALTGDQEAIDEVIRCAGEATPVVGTSYDINATSCTYSMLQDDPITAGHVVYTIAYIDTSVTPYRLLFGYTGVPDDGLTLLNRHQFLLNTEFIKQ